MLSFEENLSKASFGETCQWLKFPLNGLRAQSRVSPVAGLLPLASGPACLGMAFPPFLVKQLYRCDSVVISSFVRTGYTTRKWGWLLGRIGYNIIYIYYYYYYYVLYITPIFKKGDRMEPKNCRGIGILNTCYKLYCKILNMKLQKYSEAFMTETQNGFRKGRSCTDPTFCLKLLIEKRRKFNLETHLLFMRKHLIKSKDRFYLTFWNLDISQTHY